MPVLKRPRRKKSNSASSKGDSTAVRLPDRRAMEGFMSAISGRRANDASTAKAQEVMYEAWDQTSRRARVALAHKALTISPLCADAYVLLAEEEAKSAKEALEYYRKGVEVGAQALEPRGFKEYAGHFWGFLETRPYMRARAGLAAALNTLGEVASAICNYQDMLRLNPNDNQGIRYVLAGCLMKSGDIEALKKLLKRMAARFGSIRRRSSPTGKMERATRRPRNWRRKPGARTAMFPPFWPVRRRRSLRRTATSP